MKAAQEEDFYKTYTADSLHFILKQLGIGTARYSELLHPQPVDDRPPEQIALDRAEKMGLKVVES